MEKTKKTAQLDMLHGPIWNKLPLFALPVAATAILEQLFNASDIAVVGNFTGEAKTAAVAAVGANSPIIGLIVNLFIGVSLGANVVIAHAIGQRDKSAVHKAVHTTVLISLIIGVAVAILGEAIAAPLLGMLSVPDDVFPLALEYLRIYLLGMPVILLYNFEAAIFRSVVAVLHMTVNGVAIATVLSNAVSAALLYRKLRQTTREIHLEPKQLRIDAPTLKRILRIGLPAGIQSAVFSLSNIVIQAAINSLGTVVMAASSAAFNIEVFTYDILNAFSQACTTFVGQNYGAGEIKRCRRTLALSMIEGAIALAGGIVLILTFGKPLLSIFNSDPQVIATGYIRLMIIMISHSLSLLYEVMSGYLRGFGISLPPALLTMAGVCGVRIAWIQFVFPHSQTFQTIMTVYPVSLAVTALLIFGALVYYRPSRRAAQKLGA